MKVTLSPAATAYVRQEAAYLKDRQPLAARAFLDDLKRLRAGLERFPALGHLSPDLPYPGIHRLVMGAYLIDYRQRPTEILILSIRHGRERPPGLPVEDEFEHDG